MAPGMSIAAEIPRSSHESTRSAAALALRARPILGASFRIYMHRWRPHLAASIIAQGPVLVPTLVLVEHLVDSMQDVVGTQSMETAAPAGIQMVLLLLLAFVAAFLFVLMSGAACQLVEYWLDGQPVTLLGAYGVALRRFWRLAGAMLAVFAGVCLALAALVGFLAILYFSSLVVFQVDASEAADDPRVAWLMLGILVALIAASCALLLDALVRWAVFVQAVIIEGAGPVAALARSAALVRGKWRRTAWVMVLLTVLPVFLMMLLGAVLTVAFAPLAATGLVSSHLLNSFALIAAQLAFSPVPAIGVTVLFYALRDGEAAWSRIDTRLALMPPVALGTARG